MYLKSLNPENSECPLNYILVLSCYYKEHSLKMGLPFPFYMELFVNNIFCGKKANVWKLKKALLI